MEKVLPKGWVETTFSNLVAYVIGGDWGKDESFTDNDYSLAHCIRGSEIKNWNNDFGSTAVIRKIKNSSLSNRKLVQGDILLEISGGGPDQPVGRTVLIDNRVFEVLNKKPIVCTNFLRLIRSVENINSNFLNNYLQYFYQIGKITEYQGGSNNLRNLKYKEFETIKIPLPPLAEQERIVAKLDALFAQHEKMKAALARIPQLLKNFRQQVLTQAVTGKLTEQWREGKNLDEWREVELKDVCKSFKYGSSSKSDDQGKVAVLRMGNLQNGKLDLSDLKYSNDDKEIDKYRLEYGNVLFNRTNSPELVGKTSIYKSEIPAIYAGYLIKIENDILKLNSDYLNYFMNSQQVKIWCIEVKTDGVSQSNINAQKLASLVIPLPSLQEQQEIVARVESLFAKADVIEALYDLLKKKIEALPQAILHKAFKGELVPQLPTDGNAKDLLAEIMALKKDIKTKKK
ncbi:restriction endonuclease subunit S [Sphingobacterium sp. Mn56C]|uniref:restriction endonuclease subunit S n=1 Tax=Sphingobacterium sp. Mn56C TaxID=3395261 RepID=UPI003BC6AC53